MAKNVIWGFSGEQFPKQRCFPLEPISVWVGEDKMTSDTSKLLNFWVHKQLVEQTFYQLGLMLSDHFREVAWRQVYDALHDVPRMFQIWACKKVTNIAGVNSNQAVYKKTITQCAQVATKKRKHVDMFWVVMKKGG